VTNKCFARRHLKGSQYHVWDYARAISSKAGVYRVNSWRAAHELKMNRTTFCRALVMKVPSTDGAADWFGYGTDAKGRIEDVYSRERHIPNTVQVSGKYSLEQQEKVVSESLEVHEVVGDAIRGILPRVKMKTR